MNPALGGDDSPAAARITATYDAVISSGRLRQYNVEASEASKQIPKKHAEIVKKRNPATTRALMLHRTTLALEKLMHILIKDFDDVKVGKLFRYGRSADFSANYHTVAARAKEMSQFSLAIQACHIILNKVPKAKSNILSRLWKQFPLSN